MNQPLTSKFMGKKIHPDFTITDDGIYCLESDVKLAIEWLREQQYKELCRLQETNEGNFEKVIALIGKAFPDLYPSGDLIADKQNPPDKDKQELKKLVHEFALRA